MERYFASDWAFCDKQLLFEIFRLVASRFYVSGQGRVEFAAPGGDPERVLFEVLRQLSADAAVELQLGAWHGLPVRYAEVCSAVTPVGAASLAANLGAQVEPQLTRANRMFLYAWPWLWSLGDPAQTLIAELVVYRLLPHLDRTHGVTKVEIRPLSAMKVRSKDRLSDVHAGWSSYEDWHVCCSCWADWLRGVVAAHDPCPVPTKWRTAPFEPFGPAPQVCGKYLGQANGGGGSAPLKRVPYHCQPLTDAEMKGLTKRRGRGRVMMRLRGERRGK
ncbi:MAG: hypothetical protein H6839_02625 [Planctomycetes bacterium]|nr:hypothetical protein [Planctomycetota bacterium]